MQSGSARRRARLSEWQRRTLHRRKILEAQPRPARSSCDLADLQRPYRRPQHSRELLPLATTEAKTNAAHEQFPGVLITTARQLPEGERLHGRQTRRVGTDAK